MRLQIAIAAGILAGYGLLLGLVGTPTAVAGAYQPNDNVVTAFDELVLGRAHGDGWGTLLSAISTIATTIVGVLFGQVLLCGRSIHAFKVMVIAGLGCLAAGFALSQRCPLS